MFADSYTLALGKFLSIQNRCDSMSADKLMPSTPPGAGHAEFKLRSPHKVSLEPHRFGYKVIHVVFS